MTEIGTWVSQIIGLAALVALAVIAASVAWSVTLQYIYARSVAKRDREIVESLAMVHRWFSGFRDLDIIWDYIYGKRGGSIDSVRYEYAKARGTDVYGEPKYRRQKMTNTINELLQQLATEGGAIVCSAECHGIELADARLHGRMFVNDDGIGFVRRPKAWLDNAIEALAKIQEGRDDN